MYISLEFIIIYLKSQEFQNSTFKPIAPTANYCGNSRMEKKQTNLNSVGKTSKWTKIKEIWNQMVYTQESIILAPPFIWWWSLTKTTVLQRDWPHTFICSAYDRMKTCIWNWDVNVNSLERGVACTLVTYKPLLWLINGLHSLDKWAAMHILDHYNCITSFFVSIMQQNRGEGRQEEVRSS